MFAAAVGGGVRASVCCNDGAAHLKASKHIQARVKSCAAAPHTHTCEAVSAAAAVAAALQAGRSHMKQLMADLEMEQEKCAGLAAAIEGQYEVLMTSPLPALSSRVFRQLTRLLN
jgi:hypothetical protein